MPRSGYQSKTNSNLSGPSRAALNARNVRYFYQEDGFVGYPSKKVRTRAGHADAFNPATAIKSIFNYVVTDPILSTPVNRAIVYNGTEVKSYDVIANTYNSYNPALTMTALKISVAEAGTRCYIAGYDANGIGVAQGHVVDTSYDNDKLFEPPPTTATVVITGVEGGSGVVTAGVHNFLICVTTRTGYTTRPGPVDGSDTPIPFSITSTGGKELSITVTGTPWSTASLSVALLMTTTTNQARYFFVPFGTFGVPGGSNFGFTLTVNIDDADLEQATPADPFFDLLSQSGAGTGPFNPAFVLAYGSRMVYGAGDKVYISDPNDFQSITADQNVQTLPGLQQIRTAFTYRDGNLYLVGDTYVYSLNDTGDVPAAWQAPQAIDQKIGTVSISGLTREPSQNIVAIAATSGLRLFENGSFLDPPLSFFQTDWMRINWAAAATIEVIDDLDEQTYRVLAPLDGASSPNFELAFGYKDGKDPKTIDYSLDDVPGRYCFALVKSNSTAREEVWLGPTASGTVWRRDKTLTLDSGSAITNQIWESQYQIPLPEQGGVFSFHGAHYTAQGTAQFQMVGWAFSPGRATKTIAGITNPLNGAVTIQVTAHGFSTGTRTTLAGVTGQTSLNTAWVITVTDADHFTLNGAVGNGVGSSGGTAVNAMSSGPKITDLSTNPSGKRILRQWLLNAENESLEFSTQAGYFVMTEFEAYYTPWIGQR